MSDYERGRAKAFEEVNQNEWKLTSKELPPRGEVVMTEDSGGSQQKLKRHDREASQLWFFEDDSGYVYYTPLRWRHLDGRDA